MNRHTISSSIEDPLDTVTISPKFQVVIPRAIREQLGLQPGQKVHALAYENRIEFIPVRTMKSMRGFLKGSPPRSDGSAIARDHLRARRPTQRC